MCTCILFFSVIYLLKKSDCLVVSSLDFADCIPKLSLNVFPWTLIFCSLVAQNRNLIGYRLSFGKNTVVSVVGISSGGNSHWKLSLCPLSHSGAANWWHSTVIILSSSTIWIASRENFPWNIPKPTSELARPVSRASPTSLQWVGMEEGKGFWRGREKSESSRKQTLFPRCPQQAATATDWSGLPCGDKRKRIEFGIKV